MSYKDDQQKLGQWNPRPNSRKRRKARYLDWRKRRAAFVQACREGSARPVVPPTFAEDTYQQFEKFRILRLGDPR